MKKSIIPAFIIALGFSLISGASSVLLNGFIPNKSPKQAIKRKKVKSQKRKVDEHVVRKGETLASIAKRYLGSQGGWQIIAATNDIANPREIHPGQSLAIPSNSDRNYYQIGTASWYGSGFHGKTTTSGETFNMHDFTAAHRDLPLGTKVRVVNLENQKSIKVIINDRGPFVGKRIIDLSHASAKALGIKDHGLGKVKVEIVSFPDSRAL